MYICDQHLHTKYSFDGDREKATVNNITEAAIAAGLSEICITDHYDINGIIEKTYPDYDAENARAEIFAAKEKYKNKLTITYGIELGEATHYPTESKEFLKKYPFEYVIGSIHNIKDVPDFYYINFTDMTDALIASLWEHYLKEIEELVDFGGFSTLAHLTYPIRYVNKYGRQFDVNRYYDRIERIYRKLITKNIALEVNTSGLRQGMGCTMPYRQLIELYYECGGKMITCGSDAHTPGDVGAGILETYKMLINIGFKTITIFRNRTPEMISITEVLS